MDIFNLKNFINENKLGAYSKLKEDEVEEGAADFNYAAAKAKLAGKSEFDFEGKNYKVTMSQAAAEKIVGKADANEAIEELFGNSIFDKDEDEEFMGVKVKENRFLAASMEDLEQVVRNLAHTGEMSEDEAIEMAIRKLEAMLDGRDDLDEDLDVGHQDDEPNMLKKTMYRTAKMAAMIYKELDKFDQFPNEVDFPNWWQAKLIKANDYLNSAFDYLDGEQQTAKLDAMAEKKIEVDDDTDFKVKLSHLLDKHVDN